MSTFGKIKNKKQTLRRRRERLLAQIEDLDAELEQCSDGELDSVRLLHHATI